MLRYVAIVVFLSSSLLTACATGPVKFYPEQSLPPEQIVRVVVPGPITVKSIDGREVDAPSQEHGFYELHLSPGHHLIAFTYEMFWGDGTSGMYLKSALTAVETTFVAGKVYTINYTEPKNQDEAWTLSNNFHAKLVEPSTKQEIASYKFNNVNLLAMDRVAGQKSSPAESTATTSQIKSEQIMSADVAVSEDAVKRLKYWWLMANEKERQEFTTWMKSATETFAPEKSVVE